MRDLRHCSVWASTLLVLCSSLSLWSCSDLGIEIPGIRLDNDYELAPEHRLTNTFGATVTDDGFQFFEENLLDLVALFLGSEDGTIDLSAFVEDFLEANPIEIFDF
ncbi:MAG: hypothetical protein KC561_19975, partial [Myxococcales bacterium]|nr:hypothetical protein [Myxococcales bacterium]